MALDPDRFVTAQDSHGTFDTALAELRAGAKRSHWMWFVFPQIAGLGRSSTAQRYALADLDDARAYLAHPVLGPRLVEAATAVLDSGVRDPERLLGGIDAVKLRSSMTLFEAAARPAAGDASAPSSGGAMTDDGAAALFARVLDELYAGRRDPATLDRL